MHGSKQGASGSPSASRFLKAAAPAPSSALAARIDAALTQIFKFDRFRGVQEEAVSHLLAGNSAVVIMPTGGGKSLCYALPAILLPGITLVVSPLVALIEDQVKAFRAKGIRAAAYTSATSDSKRAALLNDLRMAEPRTKMLFVAPEAIASPTSPLVKALESAASRKLISLLAVDEAHSVVVWGHDFRPAYLKIAGFRSRVLPKVPCVALTATAAPAMRREIAKCLGLTASGQKCALLLSSFDRPNIVISVKYKDVLPDATEDLLAYVYNRKGSTGIIYARTRDGCTELKDQLLSRGISAVEYHAGMSAKARTKAQADWMAGHVKVCVATVAFGMGIDKPDVRYVVLWEAPKSYESFYQESGRAGRDGLPAESVVYHALNDIKVHAFLIQKSAERQKEKPPPTKRVPAAASAAAAAAAAAPSFFAPSAAKKAAAAVYANMAKAAGSGAAAAAAASADTLAIEKKMETELMALQAVQEFLETPGCRRQKLLAHFGDDLAAKIGGSSGSSGGGAACCDWCRNPEAVGSNLHQLEVCRRNPSYEHSGGGRYPADDLGGGDVYAAAAAAMLADSEEDARSDGSNDSDPFAEKDPGGCSDGRDGSSLAGSLNNGSEKQFWDRLEEMEDCATGGGSNNGNSSRKRPAAAGASSLGDQKSASRTKFESASVVLKRNNEESAFKKPRAVGPSGGSSGSGSSSKGSGSSAAGKSKAMGGNGGSSGNNARAGGSSGGGRGIASFFDNHSKSGSASGDKTADRGSATANKAKIANGGAAAAATKAGSASTAPAARPAAAAVAAAPAAADTSAKVEAPSIEKLRAREEERTGVKKLGITVQERRRTIAAMIKLLRQYRGAEEKEAESLATEKEWLCFRDSANSASYRAARGSQLAACRKPAPA